MSTPYQISIKDDAEVTKLVRALASKNRAEFEAAQEAIAAFIGDVILNVVEQAPVIGNLFTTVTYDEGTPATLPLDVYYDVKDRSYLRVWTQSTAGGLASNFVHGLDELPVSTYNLTSAISMLKKYAKNGRLDVVAATMERMAQEILVKQEINSASVLLSALGEARHTNVAGAEVPNGIRVGDAGRFAMNDFNRIITLLQRMRPSWVGGSPIGSNVISHLIGSPEFHEQLRSIAYQPQNTVNGATTTSGATSIAAPEGLRNGVFNAAGSASFYGVELLNVYELGVGQDYNTLFDAAIGATAIDGGAAFDGATEEVALALNLRGNTRALTRLVERGENGTLVVTPDDSFPTRSEKVGFVGSLREGRVITDTRQLGFLVM